MQRIRKNWFLIGLLTALTVGSCGAPQLAGLASSSGLKWSIVTLTMFLMAWPLEFGHLKQTVTRPAAPLLASGLNMIVIPLLVWPMVGWVGGDLGAGMMIAAATPSTLASAAIWTRRAGGDDGVAILVTMLTNGTCFLVMPFWIFIQTGSSIEPSLLAGTVYNLFFFIVLPMVAAQAIRMNARSARWATQQKPLLSTLAMMGMLSMVVIGAVSMGLRLRMQEHGVRIPAVVGVAVLLGAVHSFVFWGGIAVGRWLGIGREQQIAVAFSGSQKTLMIGLTVAVSLEMSILPIVLYHAIQLIIDTFWADAMKERSLAGQGRG